MLDVSFNIQAINQTYLVSLMQLMQVTASKYNDKSMTQIVAMAIPYQNVGHNVIV